MAALRTLVGSAVLAIAVTLGGAVWAPVATAAPTVVAPARTPAVCLPVSATGVGQDLGGGQTTATIAVRGVVIGTTTGSFTVTGVTGTVASFTGRIAFSNALGTITAPVTGTLDLSTGDFASSSSALTGTGAYSGVTGTLTFTGHEDLTTGAFTETVTGTVCLPRPRR